MRCSPFSSPSKPFSATADGGEGWSDLGFARWGIEGFNDVELLPGSRELMTISGRPLLVAGDYGTGRTVVFTGYTPGYTLKKAFWDSSVTFPYCPDQEFVTNPVSRSYFSLFMRMMALASGEKPAVAFDDLLAARDKPLFESLKDLPEASLQLPAEVRAVAAGEKARAALNVANGANYARLVRVRAEWAQPGGAAPYLVMYSDNYFDLMPGESKVARFGILPARREPRRGGGNADHRRSEYPNPQNRCGIAAPLRGR